MNDFHDLSEKEQIENIKNWLKKNGTSILGGIVLGVGGIIAWNTYQDSQTDKKIEIAEVYFSTLTSKNFKDGKTDGSSFIKKYPDSAYAFNLSFLDAKNLLNKNKYQEAIKKLEWVVENNKTKTQKILATINISKIYNQLQNPQKAIENLQKIADYEVYSAEADMIMGDAYNIQKNVTEAKKYYEKALEGFKDEPTLANITELKLNNL